MNKFSPTAEMPGFSTRLALLISMAHCLLMTACVGPLVPVVQMDDETRDALRKSVPLYHLGADLPDSLRTLSPISTTSCMNKLYDDFPSRTDAEDQLRFRASQLGGNAVTSVVCENTEGTSLAKNCWASVTCHGSAAQITTRNGSSSGSAQGDTAKISKSGTGFFINGHGDLFTAAHIIDNCRPKIIVNHNLINVDIVAVDTTNDVAILRAPETPSLRSPSIAPYAEVPLASDVIVFGFPLRGLIGEGLNAARGSVSGTSGPGNDHRLIQLTAPVQQGNSGGPVVNQYGDVIGMIVSKLDVIAVAIRTGDIPQNVNFAISAATLRNLAQNFDVPVSIQASDRVEVPEDMAAEARNWVYPVVCD